MLHGNGRQLRYKRVLPFRCSPQGARFILPYDLLSFIPVAAGEFNCWLSSPLTFFVDQLLGSNQFSTNPSCNLRFRPSAFVGCLTIPAALPCLSSILQSQSITTSIITIMCCQRLSIFYLLILVALVNARPSPHVGLHLQRRTTPSQQRNQALKTGPGGAVFWSGKTDGVSARLTAQKYAKQTGGVTLDMALKQGGLPIPEKPPPGPKQRIQDTRQWAKPSKIFAQKAQGDIHVFLGEKVRPASVYNEHEKGPLKKNPKVTSVTEHYHDGTTKVIKGQK
jgi:hypothetical protein